MPVEPGVRHRAAAGWNGSKAAGNIAQRVITVGSLNPDFVKNQRFVDAVFS